MKTCSKCKNTISVQEFSPDKKTKDGFYAWCKPCNRVYQRSKRYEPDFVGSKTCTACKLKKPKVEFRIKRICKDGLGSECKDCGSFREIKKKYGLSKSKWLSIYKDQNCLCAICLQHGSTNKRQPYRPLVVDHCHKTGRIRGLICDNCNRGIGYLQDDVSTLARAINYLGEKL